MSCTTRFNFYDDLVKNDIYVSKVGANNILFLGGCRSYAYAVYFEEICKCDNYFINGQFGISTIGVHIIDLYKRNITPNMRYVIEHADIIICEQIRRYSFLNTSISCEQNIFNNFNIKQSCKIIQIPNLELRYNINDLIFENPSDSNDSDKINKLKCQNLTLFINHCKKYNFTELSKFISRNEYSNLFVTFNHPTNSLILKIFEEIIEKLFDMPVSNNALFFLKKINIF